MIDLFPLDGVNSFLVHFKLGFNLVEQHFFLCKIPRSEFICTLEHDVLKIM